MRWVALLAVAALSALDVACAAEADAEPNAEVEDALTTCAIDLGTASHALATATTSGEQILTIDAASKSATSWGEKGNEAVVLEVTKAGARIGHFVLHQGSTRFTYAMHVGNLAAGDALSIRVSPLTAPNAQKAACIGKVSLAAPPAAIAEGVAHAPIVKWPAEKSFDDLPVLLGWSKKSKSYSLTYTNEDGGTVALCGGGARGMRSEIQRWGRGYDSESIYGYGADAHFERCTGVVPPAPGVPRMSDAHPIVYYGDGHNRLFESRAGYGRTCGTSRDKMANGKLQGWNTGDALDGSHDAAHDDPFTIVLRPVPVDADAFGSRDEMTDASAPWLYRVLDGELRRENKIDDKQTFAMTRYLYVDVYAKDVGGSGDATCGPISWAPSITHVKGGFKLRAITKDGKTYSSEQMTADFFFGTHKRMAIPLGAGVGPGDIAKIVLDAYDGDGIYFLGIGDVFVPQPKGTNGATLAYVHQGYAAANVYVDDDSSSCVGGKNAGYPCVGSSFTLGL